MTELELNQLADDDAARKFADQLMAGFKLRNRNLAITLAQGLWAHHRLRAAEITVVQPMADALPPLQPLVGQTVVLDILNMVISGDVECAYTALTFMTPDDGSESYHWLTADNINYLRGKLAGFLGW